MVRVLLILGAIFIGVSILTNVLHKFFENQRIVKYLPAIAALVVAVYNLYLARTAPQEGFQDLARILLFMMAGVAFLSGLLTSLFLDYALSKPKE